jgi:hypothetical protein
MKLLALATHCLGYLPLLDITSVYVNYCVLVYYMAELHFESPINGYLDYVPFSELLRIL